MEVERGASPPPSSPPYNSPNGEEFGFWGDESLEVVDEDTGSESDMPPLESSHDVADSGLSDPSTSHAGNETIEVIDLTRGSNSEESG